MSKITDIEHAVSAHAKWLRNEIKFPKRNEDITQGRQELLDAANASADGGTLAEYLDKKLGLERVATSHLAVLPLPESMTWEDMLNPTNKPAIADYWDSRHHHPDEWVASLPVYWSTVIYKAIAEHTIQGDIRDYFGKQPENNVLASSLVLHSLGSASRHGHYAAMRHCHLGRVWWEQHTARKVAACEECGLTEKEAYDITQRHPAFHIQVLSMSVANLTTLCSPCLLASLFATVEDATTNKIVGIKTSTFNDEYLIRQWVREIGKSFYGNIPEYMDWAQVLKLTENSLRKAIEKASKSATNTA